MKITEKKLRMLIREAIRDISIGGFSDAADAAFSDVKSKEDQDFDISVSGNYPKENVNILLAEMESQGIKNKFTQVAILATLAKESNLNPKSERCYGNTSLSRIREIWPYFKKWDDAKLNALKKDCRAFFNYTYEKKRKNKYGNRPGTNDGYDYRGRGFNQVTFRGSYEKYARLTGVDILNNPDLLNQPKIAAKVAVKFLSNRLKTKFGTNNPDFKTQDEATIAVAEANCKSPGAKKDCSRAISSARKRVPHFT